MAYVADETKKYVDYAGLKYYDELIKKFIKEGNTDVVDKLIALIGAAEKGADEKTILTRIADLETAVGDVSELDAEVANLVRAILGEKSRAEGVEGDLQNAIDAEKAARKAQIGELGKVSAEEDAADHTVKSYVDAKIADANSDIDDLKDALDALDTALHGDSEAEAGTDAAKGELKVVEDTAKAYTDAEIAKLDADEEADDAGVTVGVTEEDGVITAVSVEVADNEVKYVAATTGENAEAAKVTVADTTAVLKGDAVAEIIKYVDAMDAANADSADEAVKALEEKLYGDPDDANDKGDMGAQDAKIAALEATHAKDEDGAFKTVAAEVNEAVTALVNGAPEALDTLKEIADWIANQDENGVTDVASLVSRVDTLAGDENTAGSVKKQIKDAVDALDATVTNKVEKAEGATEEPAQPSVVVTVSEVDGALTQIAVDASVIEGRVEALEDLMGTDSVEDQIKAITGTPDENKTLQDEIDDIEELIGELPEGSDDVIDYIGDSIAALNAEVENQTLAENNDFATTGIHVKVNEENGVLTAVTASINTVTKSDIDALFAAASTEEQPTA